MDAVPLGVFAAVYAGMIVGRIPGANVDRSGIALLGAIALLATGRMTVERAWAAVDVATIALLFGLMVVSAQLRLGGFYTWLTRRLCGWQVSPRALLLALLLAVGALSAVLSNDVVCLAIAPVLVEACARRNLDPKPFLLGLAAAANVGSAATLIGNPQNMLIAQTEGLSFTRYLLDAGVPAVLGLGACYVVIAWLWRGGFGATTAVPPLEAPAFDRWQTHKGLAVTAVLMVVFCATSWPREVVALAAGGVLLASRRMHSRDVIGLVDWHLLVLFIGLFVVHRGLADSGWLARAVLAARDGGLDLSDPALLFCVTVPLSNVVSNVPAVMLLLPFSEHPMAGTVLALASTLAGNLLLVGSIANLIVVDQAARLGVRIGWREHARVGVPVTLLTILIAAGWLALVAA